VIILALLLTLGSGCGQAPAPAPAKLPELKWLGHAAFYVTTSQGTRIVLDPYDPNVGYTMPSIEADLITVSHEHADHNYVSAIKGQPQVKKGSGDTKVKDVTVRGIATFHDDSQGSKRGNNTVFVFEFDGFRVCHLGDLGHQLSEQQKAAIGKVDVLMIPVGGTYTIDAAGAAQVVNEIAPRIVVPMHYKTAAVTRLPVETADAFVTKMGGAKKSGLAVLQLKRADVDAMDKSVHILEYK